MTTDIEALLKYGDAGNFLAIAKMGGQAWNDWADADLARPRSGDEKEIVIGSSGQGPPWPSHWMECKFPRSVRIDGAKFAEHGVSFDYAEFHGDVVVVPQAAKGRALSFYHATFKGDATFDKCVFDYSLPISTATFEQEANFRGAQFFSSQQFYDVTFREADFEGAHFKHHLSFGGSKFTGHWARFMKCTFRESAHFSRCKFFNGLSLSEAIFNGDAMFTRAKFGGNTDLLGATFKGLLIFESAVFANPPELSTTKWDHPPSFLYADFLFHEEPDSLARYRLLKQLAAESHDHRGELRLFALESKSRRLNTLTAKKWTDWPELLVSRFYEVFSGYGLSLRRPIGGLLLTIWLGIWWFAFVAGGYRLPEPGWEASVVVAALSSAIPFAGQAYVARQIVQKGLCGSFPDGERLDCLTWVYIGSAVEGLFAVIFLFLFVLGVRNLFRIR